MIMVIIMFGILGITAGLMVLGFLETELPYTTITGDGYTMSVPKDWIRQPDGMPSNVLASAVMGNSAMHIYTDPQSMGDDFPTEIIVTATPTTLTRAEYNEFNTDRYALAADMWYVDREFVELSGQFGTKTQYVVAIEDVQIRIIHATIVVDGVAYDVVFLVRGDGYDTSLPYFERVVQSFRIAGH